jgi:hypothetical protein
MKLKFKMGLLAVSAGTIVWQLGSCARFLGDFVGDTIIMSLID